MSLTIIKGPPNSGRTELVRERFEARLKDDPVLVVPSTDDIFGWERRLTRERGAFLGGKVVHFKDLIDEILGDESAARDFASRSKIISPLRRRILVAEAIRDEWPSIAGLLEDQPGLIDAALQTIDEFRANLIGTDQFEGAEVADVTGPMAGVYRSYLERLDEAGQTDLPARAALASSRSLEEWQGRPVFIAGFDDLTAQQLELIRRLSRQTDVLIAITHEKGKLAMAVTEALLGNLLKIGGTVELETERPATSPDHTSALVGLERAFLDPDRIGTLEPEDAITLIEASGRRGEAEAVGAEIAALVDGGADPGEIAIAVDAPAVNGRPFLELLTEYGIPAALEAETKAPETVVGQSVLNLLQAGSQDGTTTSFLAYLRGPLGLDPAMVDETEFKLLRKGTEEASEAVPIAARHGLDLPGWQNLQQGKVGEAAREVAVTSARTLVGLNPDSLPDSTVATETQIATAICRAIDELEELYGEKVTVRHLREALTSGVVKTWAVPTTHTVQISSPYSMRAKRASYLFVVSLQEKDLGSREGSPLISRQARESLRLPELTDPEEQETYLFYSCLTVPTKAIWFSRRVADAHGKAEFPSPLISEVKKLYLDEGRGLRLIRRSSSETVFSPGRAPSVHELTLSSAATGAPSRQLERYGDAAGMLDQAFATNQVTETFRNIDSKAARQGLAENNIFSATALEAFIECPYRWFFERAVSPVRFGPDPEALAKGNLVHKVLAALYERHPQELPDGESLDHWISEMKELVDNLADRCDLGGNSAPHQIQRRQVAVEIERFLRREATRENTRFEPVDLERSFGFDKEGSKPALDGGEWQLRGVIDRVDRDPDGNGMVIDYKSGASSYKSLAEMQREGKIQLHLYLKALEELWGLDPVAGLYVPIFAAKKKPRGLIDKSRSDLVKDMDLFPNDLTEDIEAEIDGGLERASIAAGRILRGEIAHDPADCLNHFAHAGVPDWSPDSGPEGGEES